VTTIILITMADVRALLRTERAARAVPKQYKSQAVHQSEQLSSKKRKADNEVADDSDPRKRSKAPPEEELTAPPAHDEISKGASTEDDLPDMDPVMATNATVDEDEWAAFEREVATPPPSPPRQTALEAIRSKADISSAPLTSAELEERRKEELKQERIRREEDDQAEKEEASNRLAEEFEEMEALEERVRKLKEMREKLRQAQPQQEGEISEQISPDEQTTNGYEDEEDSEDELDDDDDDDDEWGFRR
jgi:hypothetical protein